MNPLTFQFKRAHWSAVVFGQRLFRGTKSPEEADFDGVVDMTPARFDILRLIHAHAKWPGGGMAMPQLRRALGVCRSTISHAIKRLMELGLVTKVRDGRIMVLYLTREGVARIRRALYLVLTGRKLARHVRGFFARRFAGVRDLVGRIDGALDDLWWLTHSVAEHLGDTSDVTTYLFRRGANRFEL